MPQATARCREPAAGEDASLLSAEIVAVTSDVGNPVEQRFERRVLGEEQGDAVQLGSTCLIGGGHLVRLPSPRHSARLLWHAESIASWQRTGASCRAVLRLERSSMFRPPRRNPHVSAVPAPARAAAPTSPYAAAAVRPTAPTRAAAPTWPSTPAAVRPTAAAVRPTAPASDAAWPASKAEAVRVPRPGDHGCSSRCCWAWGWAPPGRTPQAPQPQPRRSRSPRRHRPRKPAPKPKPVTKPAPAFPKPKPAPKPKPKPKPAKARRVSERQWAKVVKSPDKFRQALHHLRRGQPVRLATGDSNFLADTAYSNTTSYGCFDGENT